MGLQRLVLEGKEVAQEVQITVQVALAIDRGHRLLLFGITEELTLLRQSCFIDA